jgi:hypothetical protein
MWKHKVNALAQSRRYEIKGRDDKPAEKRKENRERKVGEGERLEGGSQIPCQQGAAHSARCSLQENCLRFRVTFVHRPS